MNIMRKRAVPQILVVDDNLLCRNVIAKCFEELGYNVQQAENGYVALAAFNSSVDLVVTDIDMPVMNGYQLDNKIHEKNKATPVVAMTSLDSYQLAKQQRQEFVEILDKPVTKAKCKKIAELAGLTKPIDLYSNKFLRAV